MSAALDDKSGPKGPQQPPVQTLSTSLLPGSVILINSPSLTKKPSVGQANKFIPNIKFS